MWCRPVSLAGWMELPDLWPGIVFRTFARREAPAKSALSLAFFENELSPALTCDSHTSHPASDRMPSLAAANITVTAAWSRARRSARVLTAAAAEIRQCDNRVSSSSIGRRGALVGFGAGVLGAASPANAAVRLFPTDLDPRRRFFQNLVEPWEPYFGWGERVTVRRELVPGSIWSLEQEQRWSVLAMNIRTTVVKLKSTGGLVVFAASADQRILRAARRARRG